MLNTHIFSRSYFTRSPTNCFAEYEQRTLYGAFVVTLAMLPRFIYCLLLLFFITIITSLGSVLQHCGGKFITQNDVTHIHR